MACAASAQGWSRIPLHVNSEQNLIVDVHIGDRGPFPFMIDTASSATFIGLSLVAELELTPLRRERIVVRSVGGDRHRKLYELGEIRVGDVTYSLPAAPAIPDRWRDGNLVFGMLGADFLSRHLSVFDLDKQSLVLHPRASMLAGTGPWHWAEADFARLGVPLIDGRIAGQALQIVLDTGARVSVVNRAFLEALGIAESNPRLDRVHSLSGSDRAEQKGWQLPPTKIGVAGMPVTARGLVFADLPIFRLARLDEVPAMIMGMDLLEGRRFALDYLRSRVGFTINAPRTRTD